MQRFVALVNLTQKGREEISNTVERADSFLKLADKAGVEVVELLWTFGPFDGLLIFKAPDEPAAAGLMTRLASRGYVTAQTLRAFDREEMIKVLAAAP